MFKKPMNLLKRTLKSVFAAISGSTPSHIKRAVQRDNEASTAAKRTVADYLGRESHVVGGAMGCADHPERAFGEAYQRRNGHGTRPDKGKTNRRKASRKAKLARRKVA